MIEGSKGTKQREAYRMKIEELQRKEISEGLCQTAQYQNIGCLGAKHHAAPITCTQSSSIPWVGVCGCPFFFLESRQQQWHVMYKVRYPR